MSHSKAYFLESRTNSKKLADWRIEEELKAGYIQAKDIKKGMKLEIGTHTPEDGERKKVVKVTGVKIVKHCIDSVQIDFAGSHHFDSLPVLPINWLYKLS